MAHRIGMVLALPILLLAAGLADYEEWLQRASQDPGQYQPSFGTPLRLLGLAIIQERWQGWVRLRKAGD